MATLAKMVTKTLDVGVSNTTIDLSATIKSFDVLDTKFIFGITSNQGLAINLSGATVKYIVEYYVEGKTYAIEGNCLVVDINTISFNLPDQLRGYNGKALIGIYATLTDGTKIDIKNIVVNIEPSLMDKGTDFKARYYFESFDNVLASVKDAGNKAISQINTVLPTVQSKVAEIDRQIKSLPSIPDLYVAYADDANGNGFSKTDNSKLFKGYSVRNSTSPSDYRWERNADSLIIGGENLIINGGEPIDTHGWKLERRGTGNFEVRKHSFYFNEKKNMFCIINGNKVYGYEGQEECIVYSNAFIVKKNTDYTLTFVGFASGNTSSTQVHYLGKINQADSNYSTITTLFDKNVVFPSGTCQYYQITFNSKNSNVGYIRFDNNGSVDEQDAYMFFGEVTLVEGNTAKKYQFSSADMILASNPINSILTTISSENPSASLGGAWSQLGTESKFGSTIYYWKRTN